MSKVKASYSHDELFLIFVNDFTEDESLEEFTVKELKEMCVSVGIKHTGRKKELISALREQLHIEFFNKYQNMKDNTLIGKEAWDFVASNRFDEAMTRLCIRVIERGDKKTIHNEDGTIEVIYEENDSYEACHEIVNNGFVRDNLYDDVFQQVRLYIWDSIVNRHEMYVLHGRLIVCNPSFEFDYEVRQGMYKAIYNALSKARATYNKRKLDDNRKEGFVSYDDEGNEISCLFDRQDNLVVFLSRVTNIEDLEHIDLLNDFFQWAMVKYPKEAKDFIKIVALRIDGWKDCEMVEEMHISKSTIERRIAHLKVAYIEYKEDTKSDGFRFKKVKKDKQIDLYSNPMIQDNVIETKHDWYIENELEKPLINLSGYPYFEERTDKKGNTYKVRLIKESDEKKERYSCYKNYFNEAYRMVKFEIMRTDEDDKRDRLSAHKYALIQMKKQYCRNSHGIVYA